MIVIVTDGLRSLCDVFSSLTMLMIHLDWPSMTNHSSTATRETKRTLGRVDCMHILPNASVQAEHRLFSGLEKVSYWSMSLPMKTLIISMAYPDFFSRSFIVYQRLSTGTMNSGRERGKKKMIVIVCVQQSSAVYLVLLSRVSMRDCVLRLIPSLSPSRCILFSPIKKRFTSSIQIIRLERWA